MSAHKVFCGECQHNVDYVIEEIMMTGTVKYKKYRYTGAQALCAECGSVVFAPELRAQNKRRLYDMYREKNGIISLDAILEIPVKYSIGKRPLSLLLGWGEQTLSRYCDGDIPTKQYSDILTRIYNEPLFYSELLEANKNNLKSAHAYAKSRAATNALLRGGTEPETKIYTVARYIVNECGDITPLALQKALYYIQGFYFAFHSSFPFEEDCYAHECGPVYQDIYTKYKNYRYEEVNKASDTDTASFDTAVFSPYEKAVYDSVINNICCYSGKILERFTRSETPWIRASDNLPDRADIDRIIAKNTIADYFLAVKQKYNMLNPGDIKTYAKDMFSNG